METKTVHEPTNTRSIGFSSGCILFFFWDTAIAFLKIAFLFWANENSHFHRLIDCFERMGLPSLDVWVRPRGITFVFHFYLFVFVSGSVREAACSPISFHVRLPDCVQPQYIYSCPSLSMNNGQFFTQLNEYRTPRNYGRENQPPRNTQGIQEASAALASATIRNGLRDSCSAAREISHTVQVRQQGMAWHHLRSMLHPLASQAICQEPRTRAFLPHHPTHYRNRTLCRRPGPSA